MPQRFSDREIKEVTDRYCRLEKVDNETIEGILDLYADYEGQNIRDSFRIKITASNPTSIHLPAVYEIGGRTQKIAKNWGISDIRNLHCGNDGIICLCIKQLEQEKLPFGATLFFFIENLVIPYFFALSLYEKTGTWLWGEYSHGVLGLLEYYAETTEVSVDKIRETTDFIQVYPNQKKLRQQIKNWHDEFRCLCGSRDIFSRCHPLAWEGLIKLRKDMSVLQLNAYKLLQPK